MKKSVIVIVALFTLSLASCKKEYKCECKKTFTSGSSAVITSDGEYTFKDTKARAKSRCEDQESAQNGYTRDCEIK